MQTMQALVYSNAVKKNNGKLKIYIVILVLAMLAIAGYAVKHTFFRDTVAVKGQEQEKLLKKGDYVTITSDRYFYMGYVDKKKNKTIGYYYLVEAGDAFFVVRSSKNLTEKNTKELRTKEEFKGAVKNDPNKDGNIGALLRMGMPQNVIDAHLSKYMVSDKNTGSKGWMFFLLIPLVVFVYGQASGISTNAANKKRLAGYTDISSAELSFDSEFATGYNYVKVGDIHMTQSWIFYSQTHNTFLMPVSEVMWAYKTVTQHKTNGIPTGKSYKLNIIFSDGTATEVIANDKNCDTIIENLAARGKNIIIGFSDELNEMWSSNPQQFIASWKEGQKQS